METRNDSINTAMHKALSVAGHTNKGSAHAGIQYRRCLGPLQSSLTIIDTSGMLQGQYGKSHT